MKRIVEAVRGRLVPAGKCEGAGSLKRLAPRRLTPACHGISSLVAGAVTDISGAATVAAPAAFNVVRVGDQRKVAGVDLDGGGANAVGHEALKLR